MMRTGSGFVRTTLVGGVIFLLPLLLVGLILRTGFRLAEKLSKPVAGLFPNVVGERVAVADLLAIVCLVAIAFAAGLCARTVSGQRIMQWFENSVIGSLPQFNFVRGIAESLGDDQKVEVVLVPTDAGWSLAFIFHPDSGPWQAVFIPGAPEWTSGSVAYVHADTIRMSDISLAQAMMILRKLGAGSTNVLATLNATETILQKT